MGPHATVTSAPKTWGAAVTAEASGPVVVVGAGIAGLATAFRLRQTGWPVTVLERTTPQLVGGRMATVERDGFQVDLGAPLLPARHRRLLDLITQAGLADQILPSSDIIGVAQDGQVHRGRTGNPLRLFSGGLLDPVPWGDRARILADFLRYRSALHPADMSSAARWDVESLAGYAIRRGLRPQTLDYFLNPLSCTLCLDDPATTSAVTPFLFLAFLLSHGGLFTSARGSGFLPQGLAAQLPVTYQAEVTEIEQRADEVLVTFSLPGEPERTQRACAAILAVPPTRLVAIYPQLPVELRETFAATRYSRLVQVTFCLNRATTERAVLLHASQQEAPDIASFLLQHNLSPQRVTHGRGMITTYLRGAASDRLWELDDSKIIDHVLDGIDRLRVLPEASRDSIATYVDRISPCVVRRCPGDYRTLARATTPHRPSTRIHWAGGDHLGHSTTIGSLASGQQAADRMAGTLRRPH